MSATDSIESPRKIIWAHVYRELLQHAIPDSRHHFDFLSFTPNFRGSAEATERIANLPSYQSARTLLVTPDNSLEDFRLRALKDGKRLLIATHRMRRGFIILDPQRLRNDAFELAACLDGMEKPGIGRAITLAQIRDEAITVDFCALGALVINQHGVIVWEGHSLFEVQWALFSDLKLLTLATPVVAIAHGCQVIDESQFDLESIRPEKPGEIQCDYIVTPDQTYHVDKPVKPVLDLNFKTIDVEAMNNIPPLQELRGIRMMEDIMTKGGFLEKKDQTNTQAQSEEEKQGIKIVEKLMKGFKA